MWWAWCGWGQGGLGVAVVGLRVQVHGSRKDTISKTPPPQHQPATRTAHRGCRTVCARLPLTRCPSRGCFQNRVAAALGPAAALLGCLVHLLLLQLRPMSMPLLPLLLLCFRQRRRCCCYRRRCCCCCQAHLAPPPPDPACERGTTPATRCQGCASGLQRRLDQPVRATAGQRTRWG